jgi:predicted DCC family thiol-disulfide oxidoreductase YuxK
MPDPRPIILFDGVCRLCNGLVRTILRLDRKKIFRFASLQSPAGQELLIRHQLPTETFSSFILLEDDRVYVKSTAVLQMFGMFGGIWKIFYPLILIPKPARDIVYDIIARSRISLFGESNSCLLPTEDLRQRFIE